MPLDARLGLWIWSPPFLPLPPPSTSSFLILLPFSSSLSLSPPLRGPAQCLPACSATANSHASGASLQNLWGSPAPQACRLLQPAGHKQYVPECYRTCKNARKTNQMSLNICQTECQTRCHIIRLTRSSMKTSARPGHLWRTSGAPLGHLWGTSAAPLGHLCGTSGAPLRHLWGTFAAPLGSLWGASRAPLGHLWANL